MIEEIEKPKKEEKKQGPLSYMKEHINGLEIRVSALETLLAKESPKLQELVSESTSSTVSKGELKSPHTVPFEYGEVVASILNSSFGILVQGKSDLPAFEFSIVVPDKYSTAHPDQKAMLGGHDLRPKVISYAEGINGVRQWCERVFNSFSNEIKAQVVADRSQLQ